MLITKPEVRIVRNELLTSSDWIALAHLTGEDSTFPEGYVWEEWAAWRQDMRDLFNTWPEMAPRDVDDVPWPGTRPSVPRLGPVALSELDT